MTLHYLQIQYENHVQQQHLYVTVQFLLNLEKYKSNQ